MRLAQWLSACSLLASPAAADVVIWGPPGHMLFAQALVLGASGQVRLSGPLHVLVRNT
jgi:hypothetical protein